MEMNKMVKITKDMTIGKVLEEHPEDAMKLSEVMSSFGLHCVGCGAAMFETLEQGVKVHGMDDAKVDELVEKLNGVLSKCCKIESKNKGIKLTPAAVNKVKDIMKDAEKDTCVLRVGILSGGCAGYVYDLCIEDESKEGDKHFEQDGIDIVIDEKNVNLLDGVEIDFVDNPEESGFKFNNPSPTGGCGCGESNL